MINALQLIVHVPLFSISFPQNAQSYFAKIIFVVNFDILPSKIILNKAFDFEKQEPINSNYEIMGYEAINYMLNMGSLFLIFGVILTLSIFMLFLKPIFMIW